MHEDTRPHEAAIANARTLGAAHAETMAGNSEEAAEIIDSSYAPLDGQWADGPLIGDVMRACGLDPHDDTDVEWEGDVCDAYEDAFWAHLDTLAEPHDDDHAYPLTSGGAGVSRVASGTPEGISEAADLSGQGES